MQLIIDGSAHDNLQRYLTKVIALDVREMLSQAGLNGVALQQTVEAVTFGITTIIDGSRVMEHEDQPVVPVLTFGVLDDEETLEELITSGESSFMSEYATGAVAELFAAGENG